MGRCINTKKSAAAHIGAMALAIPPKFNFLRSLMRHKKDPRTAVNEANRIFLLEMRQTHLSASKRANNKVCPYRSENHSRGVFAATSAGDGFQPMATHSLSQTRQLLVPINVLRYVIDAKHYKTENQLVKSRRSLCHGSMNLSPINWFVKMSPRSLRGHSLHTITSMASGQSPKSDKCFLDFNEGGARNGRLRWQWISYIKALQLQTGFDAGGQRVFGEHLVDAPQLALQ